MELPVEFLSKLDVINLLAIAAMLWFFNSRLDRKFDRIDHKFEDMNKKIDDLDVRLTKKIDDLDVRLTKKIDETNLKVGEIDKRLYGIETVLHMKDCCVLKQDQNLKRAE